MGNNIGIGIGLNYQMNNNVRAKDIYDPSLVDAWFMSGINNEDKPDFITGVKSNKLVLNNFLYDLNSGFGSYEANFKSLFNTGQNGTTVGLNSYSINFLKSSYFTKQYYNDYNNVPITIPSYTIEVKGMGGDYIMIESGSIENNILLEIFEDGIYKVPSVTYDGKSEYFNYKISLLPSNKDITITIPNKYEGALVFDGIDDKCICTTMPIMTDYTVIAKRKWITTNTSVSSALASKRVSGDKHDGAFTLERLWKNTPQEISFGYSNNLTTPFTTNDITWQTKNSYNGTTLTTGNSTDTNSLRIGVVVGDDYSNIAVFFIAIYNKSFTVEEINTKTIELENEWNRRLKL